MLRYLKDFNFNNCRNYIASLKLPSEYSLLFGILVFLAAFIPLYPKFPILNVKGTFVAIRAEDLLILLTYFLWGYILIKNGELLAQFKLKLNRYLLLYFLIGILSLYSALFVTHSVNFSLGTLHFLRRVELMMLLPLSLYVLTTRRRILILLTTLFVVSFLVNFYGLGQKYLSWPVISTTNSEFSKGLVLYLSPGARVNSTFAGHYDLAVFEVLVLVFVTGAVFYFKNYFLKLGVLLLGGLSFFVLILTAARLSFVAVIIGVISVLVLLKKFAFIGIIILIVVASAVYPSQLRDRFVSTININFLGSQENIYEGISDKQIKQSKLNIPTLREWGTRESVEFEEQVGVPRDITPGEPIDPIDLAVYRSFGIRFNLEWPRAIKAFGKNPFFGTGFSSLGLATDNDILRSLGEVGAFGTLSLILLFVVIFKKLKKNLLQTDKFGKFISAVTIAMIIAFVVNGLFIDVFEASKIASLFWILVGLGLSIQNLNEAPAGLRPEYLPPSKGDKND
ncbi:MAG: O-antigen ligase family protein [Candidatus Daviesbacteria bacterium]|nr:O-antigen ligase family protein [Candidatus Daviesbacteria bacterium]